MRIRLWAFITWLIEHIDIYRLYSVHIIFLHSNVGSII